MEVTQTQGVTVENGRVRQMTEQETRAMQAFVKRVCEQRRKECEQQR